MQKRKTFKTNLMIKTLGFTLLLMALLVFNACKTQSRTVKTSKTKQVKATDTNANEDKEIPFNLILDTPIFPGCETANNKKNCLAKNIQEFIGKNFNTSLADKLKLKGEKVRILTVFTIDKTGKIINIRAHSKYKKLVKEARRVIKMLPKMKPGKMNGRLVKVTYTLPIVIRIEK